MRQSRLACNRKCGSVSHLFAALAWLLAVLSLVAAWLATKNGAVWGLSAAHWYQDTMALALVGMLAALNALTHLVGGKKCGSGEGDGSAEKSCGCGSEGKCGC